MALKIPQGPQTRISPTYSYTQTIQFLQQLPRFKIDRESTYLEVFIVGAFFFSFSR